MGRLSKDIWEPGKYSQGELCCHKRNAILERGLVWFSTKICLIQLIHICNWLSLICVWRLLGTKLQHRKYSQEGDFVATIYWMTFGRGMVRPVSFGVNACKLVWMVPIRTPSWHHQQLLLAIRGSWYKCSRPCYSCFSQLIFYQR